MIDNGAPPHDPAKYDGDHRWSRWVCTRYRCRNLREETPFRQQVHVLVQAADGGPDSLVEAAVDDVRIYQAP